MSACQSCECASFHPLPDHHPLGPWKTLAVGLQVAYLEMEPKTLIAVLLDQLLHRERASPARRSGSAAMLPPKRMVKLGTYGHTRRAAGR
jgi:hypothetical protein